MKEYKDMTPEEVEEFLEYHKLELEIDFSDRCYSVLHNGTEINWFKSYPEALDFILREQAEMRDGILETLKEEGDLRDES